MSKNLFIYLNNKESSIEASKKFEQTAISYGWNILNEYSEEADLLVCIGGDGTFLSFVHKYKFPSIPIIGINTGHLGFFQESSPQDIKRTLEIIENNDYNIQTIKPVEAKIVTEGSTFTRTGVNEVLIRGLYSHVSQFSVTIQDTKIQDFSGDGVLISTPVGSTAYNYSLSGSLVSPELDILQLTPVAPMNTNAYRCFHSSILLPSNDTIRIAGIGRNANGTIMLSFDGRTHEFNNVKYVDINQSDKELHLIRFSTYDYWAKLSSKLL